MNNRDLVEKGLVPKCLNLKQAAKVADEITPKDIIDILEKDDRVKYKLVAGEYQVDTLSLLDYLDGFHKYYVEEQEHDRLNYLMDLKQGKENPRIPYSDLKEQSRRNQEKNNE